MFKLFQNKLHWRGFCVSGWKAPLGRFIPPRGQRATVFHHRANRGPCSLELYFYQIFICLVYGLLKTWTHWIPPATCLHACADANLPSLAHSPLYGKMPLLIEHPQERPRSPGPIPWVYSFTRTIQCIRLEATAVDENCCYFPRAEGPAADAVSAPHRGTGCSYPAPFSEGLSQTQGSCLTRRCLGAYLPTPQGKPIAHDQMRWAYIREALLPLSGTISRRVPTLELLWDQV